MSNHPDPVRIGGGLFATRTHPLTRAVTHSNDLCGCALIKTVSGSTTPAPTTATATLPKPVITGVPSFSPVSLTALW